MPGLIKCGRCSSILVLPNPAPALLQCAACRTLLVAGGDATAALSIGPALPSMASTAGTAAPVVPSPSAPPITPRDVPSVADGGGGRGVPPASGDAWSCVQCTLMNPPSVDKCDACGTAKPPRRAPGADAPALPREVSPAREPAREAGVVDSPSGGSNCPACTYQNARGARECEICGAALPAASGDVEPSVPSFLGRGGAGSRSDGKRPERDDSAPDGKEAGGDDPAPGMPDAPPSLEHSESVVAAIAAIEEAELRERSEAPPPVVPISEVEWVRNEEFVDPDFPPTAKSVGRLRSVRSDGGRGAGAIVWFRPQDIWGARGWNVYSGRPRASDIAQGMLGNCWFLSALSVVAEREDLVVKLLPDSEVQANGKYRVKLCTDGLWTEVVVDDCLPCRGDVRLDHPRLAFAHARGNSLWVPLIEKALAKWMGSYADIEAGTTKEGLRILTGAPVTTLDLESGLTLEEKVGLDSDAMDINIDEVWIKLVMFHEAGHLMGAATASIDGSTSEALMRAAGLSAQHAYAVLQVRAAGEYRLIQLRNPWGRMSWTGDWSDSSPRWTPALRAELSPYGAEEGIFWMGLPDFIRFFDHVDVARTRSRWAEPRRVAVPLLPSVGSAGVAAVEITTVTGTDAELCIVQPGYRGMRARVAEGGRGELGDIGALLVAAPGGDDPPGTAGSVQVLTHATRKVEPWRNCEAHLDGGKRYYLLPLAFNHLSEALAGGRGGAGGGSEAVPERPYYVTAEVHTANALPAPSVIELPISFLSKALIARALKFGTKKKPSSIRGPACWYEVPHDAGIVIVAENLSATGTFSFQLDCLDSYNLVSSRGILVSNDEVPPQTRQVVCVLSQALGGEGYRYAAKFQFGFRPMAAAAMRAFRHEPPLDDPGLHQPLPIV